MLSFSIYVVEIGQINSYLGMLLLIYLFFYFYLWQNRYCHIPSLYCSVL